MATTWSTVLPSAYTTSGTPLRAARETSRRAKSPTET